MCLFSFLLSVCLVYFILLLYGGYHVTSVLSAMSAMSAISVLFCLFMWLCHGYLSIKAVIIHGHIYICNSNMRQPYLLMVTASTANV